MTVFSLFKATQAETLFQQNVTKQETYMVDSPLSRFYQPLFGEEMTVLLACVGKQGEKMQQCIGQEQYTAH